MTTLYDGGWFSYNRSDGISYIEEAKDGVTVLCYDKSKGDKPFLLLHEMVSALRSDYPQLVSLTGSIDEGEHPRDTVLRELSEEAGVVVLSENVHWLGPIFTYKACTKATYLFFADIENCSWTRAIGDGSSVEENAYVRWHSLEELLQSKDSLLLATYARSLTKLQPLR